MRMTCYLPPMSTVLLAGLLLSACGRSADPAQPATSAGHEHHHEMPVSAEQAIGTVDFRVSCEGAQADFDRALGLMHHMMYQQARAGFEALAKSHPDCAMAHWGVATSLFQPLWPERPGAEQLERGAQLIENARQLQHSAREASLIDATAAFFQPADAYPQRIERWAQAMNTAYSSYPDDADVAALYALSRLALAQRAAQRDALFDEAESILRAVHERVPDHPGAVHYTIHATDVEGRAENALDIVASYGDIAPEVPHALHMPSHIYVRLGDWPAVIDWNRRSADAAVGHIVNGGISFHYIHAIDYLVYAHLQRGEIAQALAAFEEAASKEKHQPSFASAFHMAAMPARLAVEQRQWQQAADLQPKTPDYLPWKTSTWAEGLTWYARGLGAIHTGNAEQAREAEQRLITLRDRAKADGDSDFAAYIEVDRRILSGWIQHAQGEAEEALLLMRSAAELEGTVEKHPITPGALLPPYEALGDLLLALDRNAEALEAYATSDAIWPGRYNTLRGAAKAAEAAGDEQAAHRYRELLSANTGLASSQ